MTDPNDPRYHYPIPPEAYPGGDPAGMPPLPDPYRLPRNLDFSALYQQIEFDRALSYAHQEALTSTHSNVEFNINNMQAAEAAAALQQAHPHLPQPSAAAVAMMQGGNGPSFEREAFNLMSAARMPAPNPSFEQEAFHLMSNSRVASMQAAMQPPLPSRGDMMFPTINVGQMSRPTLAQLYERVFDEEFERLRAEKLAAERNNNPAPPPAPISLSSQKKKKKPSKKKTSSKTEQNDAAASMHMPPIISDPNKKKVGGVDENGDLVLTDSHGFSGPVTATGPWSFHEHRLFEQSCILYGWGNWKKIQGAIPGRTKDQCKSHGQKFLKHHPYEKDRIIAEHRKLLASQRKKAGKPPLPTRMTKAQAQGSTTVLAMAQAFEEEEKKPAAKRVEQPIHVPKALTRYQKERPMGKGQCKKVDFTQFTFDSIDIICKDIYERKLSEGQCNKFPLCLCKQTPCARKRLEEYIHDEKKVEETRSAEVGAGDTEVEGAAIADKMEVAH